MTDKLIHKATKKELKQFTTKTSSITKLMASFVERKIVKYYKWHPMKNR